MGTCSPRFGQPRFRRDAAHLYHRKTAELGRGETGRGTDRIGLPCAPRRYLRSIISGIYRWRRQLCAALRPNRDNDIPYARRVSASSCTSATRLPPPRYLSLLLATSSYDQPLDASSSRDHSIGITRVANHFCAGTEEICGKIPGRLGAPF